MVSNLVTITTNYFLSLKLVSILHYFGKEKSYLVMFHSLVSLITTYIKQES